MTPSNLVKEILLAGTKCGARLFRRNVGFGWIAGPQDTLKAGHQMTVTMHAGDVLLRNPRPFNNGVPGMSDTDGWLSVTVMPEMVGTQVAVYVAVEAKTGKGRLTKEQAAWIDAVNKAGGRAGVARSPEDVGRILG